MKNTVAKIANSNQANIVAFWAILTAIVLVFMVYCSFMYKMVGNAVAGNQLKSEIASLNSELSDNEFSYINSFESININSAFALGFKQVKSTDIVFLTREVANRNVAIR
jgi:hypothetical protein